MGKAMSTSPKPKAVLLTLPSTESRPRRTEQVNSKATSRNYDDIAASLARCRNDLIKIDVEYRKKLNDLLAELYGHAQIISKNKKWWEAFREDAQWQGKPPPLSGRKNALRYVLKWACANSREGGKAASFYYRALKQPWDSGATSSKVPDIIRGRGGLKRMTERQAKPKSPAPPSLPAIAETDSISAIPSLPDGKEKRGEKKNHELKTIKAKFGSDYNIWSSLKAGTRFSFAGTLDYMGEVAHITIDKVIL